MCRFGVSTSDRLSAVALDLASGGPDFCDLLGALQWNQQPCGSAAQKIINSERRHPSTTYAILQGVATLRCDGGPYSRIPGGAGGVEEPSSCMPIMWPVSVYYPVCVTW